MYKQRVELNTNALRKEEWVLNAKVNVRARARD